MSMVIYSCAENEFKIFIYSNNENTLRYSLVKAYIYVTCLYINKTLMGKFEIKIMVDLTSKYNYV